MSGIITWSRSSLQPILWTSKAIKALLECKADSTSALHSRRCLRRRGGIGLCYDFSSPYPFTYLSRTILSKPLFVLPVSSATSPSSHYHTSLLHHLPTWFPFIVISDSDSLCLPSYLPISDILYDTQTRCGRPFPGLFLYLTLASTMTKP